MISAFAASQSNREHLDFAVVTFLGKKPELAIAEDYCRATGFALRGLVVQLGWSTEDRYRAAGTKEVAYLSLEFLVGRCLRSNLSASGLLEPLREALKGRGVDLSDVLEREPDPALGNGGLGRLAACFLESLASLSLPAMGYGILYDHGLFRQELRHGWQFERPDEWDWHLSICPPGRPGLASRRPPAVCGRLCPARRMGPQSALQRGRRGLVFQRTHHPRMCAGYLGLECRAAAQGNVTRRHSVP